jgi:hypothetical protein
MEKKKRPGRPKTARTIAKEAKRAADADLDSKRTLKRSIKVWLKLLGWAEGTVDKITAGEQEPTVSLLDSLLKIISTTAERLPDLQIEAATGKLQTPKDEAPDPTKPFNGWSEDDEKDYLRDLAEDPGGMARDYLANPDNSQEMKDLLRQYMKERKDNPPPPPPEPPRLKLP